MIDMRDFLYYGHLEGDFVEIVEIIIQKNLISLIVVWCF